MGVVIKIEKKDEQVKDTALRNSILNFNPLRTFPLVLVIEPFGDFSVKSHEEK